MNKIVAILKPFDLYQKFYIYKDGKRIDEVPVEMKDICLAVVNLAKEYAIYKVDFAGPKQFASGIIKHIQENEMKQYDINQLEMNII